MEKVEIAIDAFKRGEFVIVVDDPERENEGDLLIAAEFMTPQKMSFLLQHTSGTICVAMSGQRLDALHLPLMVSQNTEQQRTAFTVSVDFRKNTTTGISRDDRYETVRALADPNALPDDFRRPGHIFPLRAKEGGVLKRAGHTETGVDLALLAGLEPAACLCEIVNPDYTMTRPGQLGEFSKKYHIPIISVADLVRYRREREKLVRLISDARLPTEFGEFKAYAYESLLDGVQHIALVKGEVAGEKDVLVRVHSE